MKRKWVVVALLCCLPAFGQRDNLRVFGGATRVAIVEDQITQLWPRGITSIRVCLAPLPAEQRVPQQGLPPLGLPPLENRLACVLNKLHPEISFECVRMPRDAEHSVTDKNRATLVLTPEKVGTLIASWRVECFTAGQTNAFLYDLKLNPDSTWRVLRKTQTGK